MKFAKEGLSVTVMVTVTMTVTMTLTLTLQLTLQLTLMLTLTLYLMFRAAMIISLSASTGSAFSGALAESRTQVRHKFTWGGRD